MSGSAVALNPARTWARANWIRNRWSWIRYCRNPYCDWIAAYAGEPCRALVRDSTVTLDRLGVVYGADARYPQPLASFTAATALEEAF